MKDRPKNIRGSRAEDHVPLLLEELSRHAKLSRAFLQLCVDTGCPLQEGRLSQAQLLNWLAPNYAAVRALAGLPELAPIDGVPEPAFSDLQTANMMLTMLEFACSRATKRDEKRQLRAVMRLVERAVEI